jgi:hypothetical protein
MYTTTNKSMEKRINIKHEKEEHIQISENSHVHE